MTRNGHATRSVPTRMIALVAGAGLVLALAADLGRPAQAQLSARATVGAIHIYQATVSPLYARLGVHCRFTPTCSRYGEAVIGRFGLLRGGWLAARRLARCGPWTPEGTMDPPPSAAEVRSKKSEVRNRDRAVVSDF